MENNLGSLCYKAWHNEKEFYSKLKCLNPYQKFIVIMTEDSERKELTDKILKGEL